MQPERPRARRYSFVAGIELTDVQLETQIRAQTKDLSLFGCHVDALKTLPTEAKVRIRITHRSANFVALGRVAYARTNGGMGIVFTLIERDDQFVLEKWIAELRDR